MKSISVNSLLKSATMLMCAALVSLLVYDTWLSYNQVVKADRILNVADVSGNMFKALHNLRVDRARTFTSLKAETVSDAVSNEIAAIHKEDSTAAHKSIALLKEMDFAGKDADVAALEQLVTKVTALQTESIAAFKQPRAQRREKLADEVMAEMTKLIDLLGTLMAKMSDSVTLADPANDKLFAITQTAWQARVSVGGAALVVVNAVSGVDLTPESEAKFLQLHSAAGAYLSVLKNLTTGLNLPQSLHDLIKKAEEANFVPEVTAESLKQIRYARDKVEGRMDANQWSTYSVPRQSAVVPIAEAAYDEAKSRAERMMQAARISLITNIGLLTIALAFAIAMIMLISRRVTTPLRDIKENMVKLANGDLSIVAPYVDRQDEMGDLGRAMATFRNNMAEAEALRGQQAHQEQAAASKRQAEMEELAKRFDRAVGAVVGTVASASGQLQAAAQTLSATSQRTADQSHAVSSASEQAAANVTSVASATEELSSSVDEISRQVSESAAIAARAVEEASNTNERVKGLSGAAEKIGSIVSLINDIAGKTNLLALNATIEAARAGDAGKGFAVVASEVKQLADQTAKATAEIGVQVGSIQSATAQTATEIEGIGHTIAQINDIVTHIARAVEDQGRAAVEISQSINDAAQGTQSVTANITAVTHAAAQSSEASAQVLQSANELSQQAEVLRVEVDNFLGSVRAA